MNIRPLIYTTLLFILSLLSLLQAKAQTLYFPPVTGTAWDTTSAATLGWCQDGLDTLIAYLGSHNTKVFLLLKDGKMVVEQYYGTFTVDSPWAWNSAGKSLASVLVGLAQEQGLLHIGDSMPKYLHQGYSTCTPANEDSMRLYHELTMTTGFNDDYEGVPNNACWADSCLVCIAAPGTRWAYHNAPYTLLHHILDTVTHVSMTAYTTSQLHASTGITGSWIIPPADPYDEIFYSKARSMARLGMLMLGKGIWNGDTVIHDTDYYHAMINTSQGINLSYGYLWWLNGKASYHVPNSQLTFTGMMEPHAPTDMYAALGKNDQILNVVPSMGIVLVRMGNAMNASFEVPAEPNDTLWVLLNAAFCNTVVATNGVATPAQQSTAVLQVFPNPAQQLLYVKLDNEQFDVTVSDITGRVVRVVNNSFNTAEVPLEGLSEGVYVVKVVDRSGKSYYSKVVH